MIRANDVFFDAVEMKRNARIQTILPNIGNAMVSQRQEYAGISNAIRS